MCEYYNIVNIKWWEPATSKEKFQYQTLILKACTVAIGQYVNKDLNKVDLNIYKSGNGSNYGGG